MSLYALRLVPEGEGEVMSLGRVPVERAVQRGRQQWVEEGGRAEVAPGATIRQLLVETDIIMYSVSGFQQLHVCVTLNHSWILWDYSQPNTGL